MSGFSGSGRVDSDGSSVSLLQSSSVKCLSWKRRFCVRGWKKMKRVERRTSEMRTGVDVIVLMKRLNKSSPIG